MRLAVWTTFLAFMCYLAMDAVSGRRNKNVPKSLSPMPKLITQHGYPAETHTVTTEDGYILTMHRIPYSPKSNSTDTKRPVVFLQHGLISSSVDWVIMGPDKSLAYLLADGGYDVWMGNSRGNMYSTKHNKLSAMLPIFWSFSWHEMGVYDLPAEIDYILTNTGQNDLSYVGHSMGTTMFFALMSVKPDYNAKIRHMVALAPVAFLRNTKSPFASITKLLPSGVLFDFVSNWPFFPNKKLSNGLLGTFCKIGTITQSMCTNTLFQIGGFNTNQLNQTMLPTILHYFPAGSSIKAWKHYGQLINSGSFRQYDHGLVNLYKYGNLYPPDYNLDNINSSVSLVVGANDWLATPEDATQLQLQLPFAVYHEVGLPEFNHFDFLWAIDVKTLVNDKVLSLLKAN
ncbi:lipase 3-like [Zootermopsis nevadensis]|uniref:Lipase n=1 Tax=Zootermopsis nevadensis TaxID=136037 RepID=A0A067R7B4_ZOONE|nr:lipase 3-like [Zootermopsis nevadensis]KDR15390.1 Lipase 3 [Zootermopsis nevadensis]